MDRSRIAPVDLSQAACSRRRLLQGSAALGAASLLGAPRYAFSQSEKPARRQVHPHADPRHRRLAAEQAGRGYVAGLRQIRQGPNTATTSASPSPTRRSATLFQKAATSLATRSQEYNIIISDSQWLGALATPRMDRAAQRHHRQGPDLNIEWWSTLDPYELSGVPRRQRQALGLSRRSATSRHVHPQGHPRGAGRGGGLQGQARPQAAHAHGRISRRWTYDEWVDLIAFFDRPTRAIAALPRSTRVSMTRRPARPCRSCARTGGDIWDPKTGQVEGILDTPSNAKAMELYKSWLKYPAAGGHQLFHRGDHRRLHPGQGLRGLAVGARPARP